MARKPRSFGDMVGIWTSKYPSGNQWRKRDTRLVWDSGKGKTSLARSEMTVGKAVPVVPRACCPSSEVCYGRCAIKKPSVKVCNKQDCLLAILSQDHSGNLWCFQSLGCFYYYYNNDSLRWKSDLRFFFKITFHGYHLCVWLAKSLCNIHGRFAVSALARERKLNKL